MNQPARPQHEALPKFTFDDWASLYKTNPAAFESRRQAVLAIELSKLGPKGARARVCLANLEKAMEGKSPQERTRLSLLWMTESAVQMQEKLGELTSSVERLAEELSAVAAQSKLSVAMALQTRTQGTTLTQ